MIEEIHIHDLGVITDAVLPLGPGLSILSGETGAGKTMVVTALGMLLGNRADAGSVRSGSTKALAEATVRVPSDHAAVALVEESGGAVDSETVNGTEESLVLLSRTVSAEGRSRAHVGGRSAPVGTLGAVGETLVAVHGQSDQLRLKSPAAQRTALDDYAGADVAEELATYRGKLARYREVVATLRAAKENSRERALQAQALTTALEEIDAVEPVPGEDAQLDAESEKLTNLEALRGAALSAHGALSGSDADDEPDLNAVALLSHAQQAIDLVAESDPELVALATRVRELTVVAADVAADLSGYASGLDEDGPARLAEVEARRSALRALTKKYGASIDEVLSWADEARTRLEGLVVDPQREEQLRAEGESLHAALVKHATRLLELRRVAAKKLAGAVSEELSALAMPNASLVVAVEPSERFTDDGRDTIEFMLALEVVLSEVDPVPTFVFDEVDSGVGGKAAVEIGRRLKMLAKNVQVLVVTHLPQVAAFADQHILVTKSSDSSVSDVKVLTDEERVVELARMLAGHEDSRAAREHARELMRDATA